MKLTERKRLDILNAAIAEFREQGFVAGRINRIAETAGVSKRTLYKHFESKDALFDAILEITFADMAAIAPVVYDPARGLPDQLRDALTAYMNVITGDEFIGMNRLVMSEYLRDQDLAKEILSRAEVHNDPMTGLIDGAMAAGALRQDDPTYAATQLLSLIKTFFFWPKFLIGEEADYTRSRDEILDDCITMFLSHYRMG